MTIDAGKRLVGQVLEVRYRLPRIWRRVVKGELAWWRAGRIAQHTMHLPKAGAALVDGRLAATAHKVGVAHTEKLCQEALDHYDPIQADERRIAAAENRKVDVHLADAGRDGTVDIVASTDTADAIDLDTALAQAAAQLAADGSTDTLDVRRSQAIGVIARHYLGTGLGPTVKPRQVTINVHLRDQDTGRCDTTRAPISVEQVKGWCTHPDTQVIIRPIKDLNAHIRVDAIRGPRPTRPAGQRTRRHLHPPLVHPTRHQLRRRPLPAPTTAAAPAVHATSLHCAADITEPRPTPDGPTDSSDPAPTSGDHPPATGSTATAPAPPTSDGSTTDGLIPSPAPQT